MRTRPPLAWTAGVLAVHVVLLLALVRSGSAHDHPGEARRPASSLVLVDAARVAAATATPDVPTAAWAASSPAKAHAGASAPTAAPTLARNGVASPTPDGGLSTYRPQSALDVPVRFRSSPDISMLSGLPWSGVPLRVRLLIDTSGTVVDVQMLRSAEVPELEQRVRAMFLATGFTPGVERGRLVPCYKDIEMNVGNPR